MHPRKKRITKKPALTLAAITLALSFSGGLGCNMKTHRVSSMQLKEEAARQKIYAGIQAERLEAFQVKQTEMVFADKLMQAAEPYLGVRYRFGGTTTKGIDCSGFTRAVYEKLNLKLPRNSKEQAQLGSPVSRENLKAGDLVFFDIRRRGVISHVGIYVGKNTIVHASRHSGVTLSSLDEDYYDKYYYSARRVLSDEEISRIVTDSLASELHETDSSFIRFHSRRAGDTSM